MSTHAPYPMHPDIERAVGNALAAGWTAVSITPTAAKLVKGHPTSHLLHLILSIVTCGLWIPVWILLAMFAGQKSRSVWIDTGGRFHRH